MAQKPTSEIKFESQLGQSRSEEHTSELQSHLNLVCRLLLEKKNGPARVRARATAPRCRRRRSGSAGRSAPDSTCRNSLRKRCPCSLETQRVSRGTGKRPQYV